MGLLDGYFDPQQFGEGGGLLGRLLALQQSQGLYQPDAKLDQALSASPVPLPQPMSWPTLPGYGPTSSSSQAAAPNPALQYQALLPILGDRNAMLATIHPDIGRTLIAQALANQQKRHPRQFGFGQRQAADRFRRIAGSGPTGFAIRSSPFRPLCRRALGMRHRWRTNDRPDSWRRGAGRRSRRDHPEQSEETFCSGRQASKYSNRQDRDKRCPSDRSSSG
jgi:hypothetical protein